MKFVSKNLNLRIVLKPGIEANKLTGQPSTPGVYAKFEDGILVVNDEKMIEGLLAHPGFNSDFIKVDDDAHIAPRSSEPLHVQMEIDHGAPGKVSGSPRPITLSPEVKELIMSMATEMAKQMVKAKESADNQVSAAEVKPVKKTGRPSKKVEETVEDAPETEDKTENPQA